MTKIVPFTRGTVALLAVVLVGWSSLVCAADPAGVKVVSGGHFDVFVQKRSEKPMAGGSALLVFEVTVVARTRKHGLQRFKRRVETINSDLLQATAWEIVDLDGDGVDDYRYRSGATPGGCQTWEARRWDVQHERFELGGSALAKWVDKKGKPVKSCVGQA